MNCWLLTLLSDISSICWLLCFPFQHWLRTSYSSAEQHSPQQAQHLAFISWQTSAIRKGKPIVYQIHCPAMSLPWNSPLSDTLTSAQDQDEEFQAFQIPHFIAACKYLLHTPNRLFFVISPTVAPSSSALGDVSSHRWHPGLTSFDIRTVHLAEYEAILHAGPIPTMTLSSQKCNDTLKLHWRLSPHLTVFSTVFMWTLFGPYPSIQSLHLHLHLPILPLSQGNSNG